MPEDQSITADEQVNVEAQLVSAIYQDDSNLIKSLIRKPININEVRDNLTPLHIAANCAGYETIMALLQCSHLDVNRSLGDGCTALHRAARIGNVGAIRALLTCEQLEVNCIEKWLDTPLHNAARHGHADAVDVLLTHEKIDINARDTSGLTPLQLAAAGGHLRIVVSLLQCQDIEFDTGDYFGVHALHYAHACGASETVTIIAKRMVDFFAWRFSAIDPTQISCFSTLFACPIKKLQKDVLVLLPYCLHDSELVHEFSAEGKLGPIIDYQRCCANIMRSTYTRNQVTHMLNHHDADEALVVLHRPRF